MALAKLPSGVRRRIRKLMESGTRAMGLRLCFHDRLMRTGLPGDWRTHGSAPCMAFKASDADACVAFDAHEVHTALAGSPEGRAHTCPAGYTELAVPVSCEGEPAGVLFAGVCWTERREPPHPGLVVPPDSRWLGDRLVLLRALAARLGELLRGEPAYVPQDRRGTVMSFLVDSVDRPVELAELAEELGLSPSRTGHVVRELFGRTFPELVRSVKMREAAERLAATDLPIGEVAALVGYEDQSYFSRLFAREFGMPPREYRRRYPAEA